MTFLWAPEEAYGIRWASEADWDASASSTGIVHEETTNTDYNDPNTLRAGYPTSPPLYPASCVLWCLGHETANETMYDFSGNGRNGTSVGNPIIDQPGILDTTAWEFDGTDDGVEFGDLAPFSILTENTQSTVVMWVYTTVEGSDKPIQKDNEWGIHLVDKTAGDGFVAPRFDCFGSNTQASASDTVPINTWVCLGYSFDITTDTDVTCYVNGEQDYTDLNNATSNDTTGTLTLAAAGTPITHNGLIGPWGIWKGTAWSASEHRAFYNMAANPELISGAKVYTE